MSNILLLSENSIFKEDLIDQIKHHVSDFEIVDDYNIADIIIIDEDLEQFKICEKNKNVPIIFLSKEGVDDVKVQAVLQKPFSLSEFIDTLKASINIFENSSEGCLEFNKYILYPSRKEIYDKKLKIMIKLTEREVSVIKYLYKNAGKIVSKNDLMQEVWEYSPDVATHTVETHIYRLRQKVEQDNPQNQFIITSDGGYQLKI
jgi:DNA-binding response OmpR family regulator